MFEGWKDCVNCDELMRLWILHRPEEPIPDELKYDGWKTPELCETLM